MGTIFGGLTIAREWVDAGGRWGMLFSVNKMLRSLSNAGRGFCVGRARVSREVWVSDFAMPGWVEMAQIRGYLPPGAVF